MIFEVQWLLATYLEGDSKRDVLEVVSSVCSYHKQLIWMNAGIVLLLGGQC